MWRFYFRFQALYVAIGGFIIAVGTGLFAFFPDTKISAVACFTVGILVTAGSCIAFRKSGPIMHNQWSLHRIIRALGHAPETATIQILQTWFPEENFVTSLERLYKTQNKRFHLRVMIIDPHGQSEMDVLAARVKLRGIDRARAVGEVMASLDNICKLKRNVDAALRLAASNGGTPGTVDLQVKLYNFLPFGPIYKIGDEVMFIGFYLSHVSSVHGPMIEVRKEACPDLWQVFEEHFRRGWEGSIPYFPAKARGRTK